MQCIFFIPLDIDYAMIEAFPDVFCEKDVVYGERGPSAIKFDVAEDLDELIKAVLKKEIQVFVTPFQKTI